MNKLLKVTLITAIMATSGMAGGDKPCYQGYMPYQTPVYMMPVPAHGIYQAHMYGEKGINPYECVLTNAICCSAAAPLTIGGLSCAGLVYHHVLEPGGCDLCTNCKELLEKVKETIPSLDMAQVLSNSEVSGQAETKISTLGIIDNIMLSCPWLMKCPCLRNCTALSVGTKCIAQFLVTALGVTAALATVKSIEDDINYCKQCCS